MKEATCKKLCWILAAGFDVKTVYFLFGGSATLIPLIVNFSIIPNKKNNLLDHLVLLIVFFSTANCSTPGNGTLPTAPYRCWPARGSSHPCGRYSACSSRKLCTSRRSPQLVCLTNPQNSLAKQVWESIHKLHLY